MQATSRLDGGTVQQFDSTGYRAEPRRQRRQLVLMTLPAARTPSAWEPTRVGAGSQWRSVIDGPWERRAPARQQGTSSTGKSRGLLHMNSGWCPALPGKSAVH